MDQVFASLFVEVMARGIEHDHHESDLYMPYSLDNTKMVEDYGLTWVSFIDKTTGKLWIDVPFAYDPFWWK